MSTEIKSQKQKALEINLDSSFYGVFAEIGAGQEVARYFFKAGAASGTIAKTISAYDMTYSDHIYGKEETGRYVCDSRLKKMLDREYTQITERLGAKGDKRRFFAYANTVAIRNFHGTNDPHGWMGVRFQHEPGGAPSEVVIHFRLFDLSSDHQQDIVGALGVNLTYAAFYMRGNSELLAQSIIEEMDRSRIEIDMVRVSGPAFESVDNRLVQLELVKKGLCSAFLYTPKGEAVSVSDYFYKKNIMVVRGSYRPPTLVNVDMFMSSLKSFCDQNSLKQKDVVAVAELSLGVISEETELTSEDFLARVDLINCLGAPVLVSNYSQYYKLSTFFSRFKPQKLAIVLGIYNFVQIFDEKYNDAAGGLLESLGLLFRNNTQIYVYPSLDDKDQSKVLTSKNIELPSNLQDLYKYFVSGNYILDVQGFDQSILHIYSRKVLNMIQESQLGWEQFVPQEVAQAINDKCLFGHPCELGKKD